MKNVVEQDLEMSVEYGEENRGSQYTYNSSSHFYDLVHCLAQRKFSLRIGPKR